MLFYYSIVAQSEDTWSHYTAYLKMFVESLTSTFSYLVCTQSYTELPGSRAVLRTLGTKMKEEYFFSDYSEFMHMLGHYKASPLYKEQSATSMATKLLVLMQWVI